MRKNVFFATLFFFGFGIASAFAVNKEGGMFSANARVDASSKYVFRGIERSDGLTVQPQLKLGLMGFALGAFTNIDLHDKNDMKFKPTEIHLSFGYGLKLLDMLGASAGLKYYLIPEIMDSNLKDPTELYASIFWDLIVQAGLNAYYDFRVAKAPLIVAELGYSHDLAGIIIAGLSVDGSIEAGLGLLDYNKNTWGVDKQGLSYIDVTLATPFKVAGVFKAGPQITYSRIMQDIAGEKNHIFGGVFAELDI